MLVMKLEKPSGKGPTESLWKTLTREEIIKADDARVAHMSEEIRQGFRTVEKYPKSVTFFGSARFREGDKAYDVARSLGYKLAKEGYAIVTGGGPGIMEAGNRGAKEAGGQSIGLNIKLPSEQKINPYVTDSAEFSYFFARRIALAFAAEAYIFFPGGYGTLDEFYEIVTMVQTRRVEPVPLICVGSEFWNSFDSIHKDLLKNTLETISEGDEKLYKITDDEEEIIRIVKAEPIRNGIEYPHEK